MSEERAPKTLEKDAVEMILRVTSGKNLEEWNELLKTLWDARWSFRAEDANSVMMNCMQALDSSNPSACGVILAVMCYLANFCDISRVGFGAPEFGEVLMAIVGGTEDPGLLEKVLDLVQRFCCACVEDGGGTVAWARSMVIVVLRISCRQILASVFEAATALLRVCDGGDQLFGDYVAVAPYGDFAFPNWLEGFHVMVNRWPETYERVTPELVGHLLDTVQSHNPKVVMCVVDVLVPVLPRIADELVKRDVIGMLLSQRQYGDSVLSEVFVHFLKFIEAFTRASPAACQQFVERQGFSFGTLYNVGFKGKVWMVCIMKNVCDHCPVPTDEMSKSYISDAVESVLDWDDEEIVVKALLLCDLLVRNGYSLHVHDRLESLAGQTQMPKAAEAAQAVLKLLK